MKKKKEKIEGRGNAFCAYGCNLFKSLQREPFKWKCSRSLHILNLKLLFYVFFSMLMLFLYGRWNVNHFIYMSILWPRPWQSYLTMQYSAKLLKKPDQCRAVYACSHLFWLDDHDNMKDGERWVTNFTVRFYACLLDVIFIAVGSSYI